jgi:hypothetical protein
MSNNNSSIETTQELQPLREVGSLEKTQYWDREEIMEALRVANYRGIRIDSLYSPTAMKTSRVPLPTRQAS